MTESHKRRARSPSAAGELLRRYAKTHDPQLREQIVLAHADLTAYLARRFAFRGEPFEDLHQVAQIGLLNAIDRFDLTRGVQFVTYATTTIVGEIKRYFRDKSWSVHVPRRLRELNNRLMRTLERLTMSLGRSPTVQELAGEVGVSLEEAIEALEVGRAYSPASLDAESSAGDDEEALPLREYVGSEDIELGRMEDRHTIEGALRRLPEREQAILRMRYYEQRSQADIAQKMGISQMHVSRLQRDGLRRLRQLIEA